MRAIGTGSTIDLPPAAQDAYAATLDFLRGCMDVMDVASRIEMLGYGDTVEEIAAPLWEAGSCLCAAVRYAGLAAKSSEGAGGTLPTTIIYEVAALADQPPKHIVVSKNVDGRM